LRVLSAPILGMRTLQLSSVALEQMFCHWISSPLRVSELTDDVVSGSNFPFSGFDVRFGQ